MSETGNKGPLIKKKPKSMDRPKPVTINTGANNGFKFNSEPTNPVKEVEETKRSAEIPVSKKPESPKTEKKSTPRKKRVSVVGKDNSVKSIKVPHDIHVKIGILGKFMDENKTYAIISDLIDYYKENELTDRQQKQFEYMTEFLNSEE